jgi:hypothetical protein
MRGCRVWDTEAEQQHFGEHSCHLKTAHPAVSSAATAVKADVASPPAWPLWYRDNKATSRFNTAIEGVAVQHSNFLPCASTNLKTNKGARSSLDNRHQKKNLN